MNNDITRLIKEFLSELSDRFSCDGCNDWVWPDWVSEETRKNFSVFEAKEKGQEIPELSAYVSNVLVVEWLISQLRSKLTK